MKKKLLFFLFAAWTGTAGAQALYEDSETASPLTMVYSSGTFQRGVQNPDASSITANPAVSSVVRTDLAYDVFVYSISTPCIDVSPYVAGTKKIRLDFFSAYPGTQIQLVLANANKSAADYPAGRQSAYLATTTKTNEWETLTFDFSFQPDPTVSPYEVDQVVILIDPAKTTSGGRTYYLDNLYGPDLITPKLSNTLYDDGGNISLVDYPYSSGTLTRNYTNPFPQAADSSARVLRYDRSAVAYDDISIYPQGEIIGLDSLISNMKKMTLQIYSPAAGTRINLILSDRTVATSTNYPKGRHSIFTATTTKANEWETIVFEFVIKPDPTLPTTGVNGIDLQIAPNIPAAGTFYLDNFYGPDLFIPKGTVNLHINEIESNNIGGIKDFEGHVGDWIEIYNSGDGQANLKGYYLSDDPANPQKYQLPNLYIYPGQYVLLWATGKDTVFASGEIHTSFKVGSKGDTLLLSDKQGTLLDTSLPVALGKDISYGRNPDGGTSWSYFNTPTPGSSNNSPAYDGFLTAFPVFSQKGGFYESPVTLTISDTSGMGAQVRYTLDGSEPTINSPLLTGPLPVNSRAKDPNVLSNIRTTYVSYINWYSPTDTIFKATIVRARLFKNGSIPGPVVTNTYFVDNDMKHRYSVPVLSLVTDTSYLFNSEEGIMMPGKTFEEWRATHPTDQIDGGTPANYSEKSDEWERRASLEFFEPDGSQGFKLNTGVRMHGGWSRAMPQKSFRLYFGQAYDSTKSLKYPVFPGLKDYRKDSLTKFRSLILRNGGGDYAGTRFRDELEHSLAQHTNVPVQAFRPSVVFLDGEYWGIMNIRERIDRYYFANHYNINDNDVAVLTFGGTVAEGTDADSRDYQDLVHYVTSNDIASDEVYRNVSRRMDIDNYINYQAIEIFVANSDWPGNNIMYWKNRAGNPDAASPGLDGRWRWIMQDLDFGLGGASNPTDNTLILATEAGKTTWPNPDWSTLLFRTLLKNTSFRNQFVNTICDQMNTSFKPSRALALLNQIKSMYDPLMDEHIQRWQAPYSRTEWERQVKVMSDFLELRPAFQRNHLMQFFQLPGTVDITVDVHNNTGGEVKVNSVRINSTLPGVTDQVYPWTGTYLQTIPVKITAIPLPGYKFFGWNGSKSSRQDTIVSPLSALNLTAWFVPVQAGDQYPAAWDLSKSNYYLSEWSSSSEAGTYPPSMIFRQSTTADPGLYTPMEQPYSLSYNMDSKTRIEGLNEQGFAFINTGSTDNLSPGAAGRDLGAAILAIRTTHAKTVKVSFTAGTVLPNKRPYAIRLQYRVGATGAFKDVTYQGSVVQYKRQLTEGQSQTFEGILLPDEALNQPYVQLRWVYYYIADATGARSKLRVDDIKIETDLVSAVVRQRNDTRTVLYPNPSEGTFRFTISNSYHGEIKLSIIDLTGKTTCTSSMNKTQAEMTWESDCMFDKPGIYLLRWQAGDEQGVERVAVIK